MEILLGTIATTVGAAVLFGLTETVRAVTVRRNAAKELKVAALTCLDRLQKIRRATSVRDEEQQRAELHRLGPDLDRWRDCIATAPDPREHWHAYEQATQILLSHQLVRLDDVINTIGSLFGLTRTSEDGAGEPV